MNSKNTKNRVVITGIGPLTAGGSGTEEVWESVKKCRTGITNEEYEIGIDVNNEKFDELKSALQKIVSENGKMICLNE